MCYNTTMIMNRKEYNKQYYQNNKQGFAKRSRQYHKKHPLYSVWYNMKQRCLNPNNKNFMQYGKRGITICSEWLDFNAFELWGINSGYYSGLTIDRVNNNKGYTPSNCQLIPQSDNSSKESQPHNILGQFCSPKSQRQ